MEEQERVSLCGNYASVPHLSEKQEAVRRIGRSSRFLAAFQNICLGRVLDVEPMEWKFGVILLSCFLGEGLPIKAEVGVQFISPSPPCDDITTL